MCGQLPSGIWEGFAYDYVNGVKKTPAQLHGNNPTGVTVSSTALSGGSSITLAKTGGTGNWVCIPVQQGACQFVVAGDTTTYQITIGSSAPEIDAGSTATFSITPNLTRTETAGTAVTMYFKTNDLRVIGDTWIQVTDSPNLSVQLYDINMNFISNVASGMWSGNTPHMDSGVDPSTGDPTVFADAGNDISGPCSPTGIEKINLITAARTCLLNGVSFNVGGHYTLTADGKWLFIHETNSVVNQTTCFDADLPANWASTWGKYYNEMILIKTDGTAYYRQGYHYSRLFQPGCSTFYYTWDPRVAISYDGKYGVFDSNFDTNPAVSSGALYTDVYLLATGITGPSGNPPQPPPSLKTTEIK